MNLQENIPLAPLTTFKIGGNARAFAVVKTVQELKEALAFARAQTLPVFILGGGSNVLVSDAGFSGLVIKMEMKGATFEKKSDHALVTAWAGESWDELVAKTVEWGVWGIENLSAIPGTVGASPVQNIGAYGVEVMSLIDSVRTIDTATGREKVFSNAECGFTYRTSIFKKPEYKKYAIVSVSFKLSLVPQPNLSYKDIKEYFATKNISDPSQSDIRNATIEIRSKKFPDISQVGTAGSFWKNPIISRKQYDGIVSKYPGLPAFPANAAAGSREVSAADNMVKVPLAWILDKICNLKGHTAGKVSLFKNQPIVLVADRGATSGDVNVLADEVKKIVKEKTGIEIEREVESL